MAGASCHSVLGVRIMGEFVIRGWLRLLGWAPTAAMAVCVVGMAIDQLVCLK
jgi:hypothetical protein